MVGAPIKTTVVSPPAQPQKPRPASPVREGGSGRRNGRPGTLVCALVSVWIVWHISAVFLAAVSTPGPTSPLVMMVAQGTPSHPSPMQWYLDALYLNQGHSFFAPEVGPGHVIHYELFDQANQRVGDGTLPDKKEQWPRLFYHRHMMLADQIEISPDDKERSAFGRQQLEGYARQLLRKNRSAQAARVQLFAHWPLPIEYVLQGRPQGYQRLAQEMSQSGQKHSINDQGFELMGEAVQRRSDMPPEPDPPPEPEPTKQSFAPPQQANPSLNWRSDRPNMAERRMGGPRR